MYGIVLYRGFPVLRREIGHLVPIFGVQQLAGPVHLGGLACPSGGCQVGRAAQLIGPAPTSHGALGGRQESARCGLATCMAARTRR